MQDDVCKELKNLLNSQITLYEKSVFPLDAGVLQKFLQTARSVATVEPISATSQTIAMPPTSPLIQEDLIPTSEQLTLPSGTKQECWQWLKNRVLTCPTCLSHVHPGKKVVFGSGNLDADIFFCGEAPGADEEEQGEVFVGRAGQLLTKIIEAMGLHRSHVYIGNIMNWRPETPNMIGNRPPTQAEMEFCLPYLKGQVDIVQPKVIVALGATAVNGLFGHDASRRMRDCRGQWFSFHKIPLLVTYHPSYLLRNATKEAKRTVWEDMLHVMEFLHMPISDKQKRYFL